jgi:hypothetical protein
MSFPGFLAEQMFIEITMEKLVRKILEVFEVKV